MRTRRTTDTGSPPRYAVLLPALLLAAVVLAACSAETRYRVKTVFFTGVPVPGAEQAETDARQEQADALAQLQANRRRQVVLPEQSQFIHGPKGAGQCGVCHSDRDRQSFRSSQAQALPLAASDSVGLGTGFTLAQEELCVSCHAEKSQAAATAQGLWLHGPVSKGWCTGCHNPHASTLRYMLTAEAAGLCNRCHLPADLARNPAHGGDGTTDCTTCHNPHLGLAANLLRSGYDERHAYR